MKHRKISSLTGLTLLVVVAMFPSATFATWSTYLYDGTKYGIHEGNNYIPLGLTAKEARKTAHKVNKAMKKDKADKGVVDDGRGPCGDPGSGVLC